MLTHLHPDGRWEEPCNALYALLQEYGDDRMHAGFARCVLRRKFTVDGVAVALREVA